MGNYSIAKKLELVYIAHGKADPVAFCKKIGIEQCRNLEIYLKRMGLADGHIWTYGELANEYGVSRPRVVQICQRTETLIRRFATGGT